MQTSQVELTPRTYQHDPAVLDSEKKTKDCYKVLFVCLDNSVHSMIAEAILKRWGEDFRAFSAGIHPSTEVNPLRSI